MSRTINITVDRGIIRVRYTGDVEYAATTEMLKQVGKLAAEKQVGRLLIDVRDANYLDYHVGTLRHAEEGPSLGIDHSFRIAFLGAPANPMLGYIEAVSVNRGYDVKTFVHEDQALAWLRGE